MVNNFCEQIILFPLQKTTLAAAKKCSTIFGQFPIRNLAKRASLLIHFAAQPTSSPAFARIMDSKFPVTMGNNSGNITITGYRSDAVKTARTRRPELHFIQQGKKICFFTIKSGGRRFNFFGHFVESPLSCLNKITRCPVKQTSGWQNWRRARESHPAVRV